MTLRVPAIQFDAVTYSQPSGVRIFDELTLGVDAGEVLALVGRSGAGKTTLLRLVNRLALPQSGRVIVGERDTREWDPIRLRRSIGYVIQDVGLFPHMTVAGNIGVVPRLENWEPSRIQARTRELLDLVGLSWDTHAGRWPDELSGGQRQRVGVARALAADPAVLLMDEPFGALDPVTRAELQREFRGIQKRLHKTVIIVTHDMLEALSLAHRVAVLDEGTVIACDIPERIVQGADPRIRRLLDAVTLKFRPDA
jgi:osmoprotectant transport system ATP-binding protein